GPWAGCVRCQVLTARGAEGKGRSRQSVPLHPEHSAYVNRSSHTVGLKILEDRPVSLSALRTSAYNSNTGQTARPIHAAPRTFDGRALDGSGPRWGSRDSAPDPVGRSTHRRRVYRVLLVFSKHPAGQHPDARHSHLLWRVRALQGLAQPNTAWMRPGGATLHDEYLYQLLELHADHSGYLHCPPGRVRQHGNEATGNHDCHGSKRWQWR